MDATKWNAESEPARWTHTDSNNVVRMAEQGAQVQASIPTNTGSKWLKIGPKLKILVVVFGVLLMVAAVGIVVILVKSIESKAEGKDSLLIIEDKVEVIDTIEIVQPQEVSSENPFLPAELVTAGYTGDDNSTSSDREAENSTILHTSSTTADRPTTNSTSDDTSRPQLLIQTTPPATATTDRASVHNTTSPSSIVSLANTTGSITSMHTKKQSFTVPHANTTGNSTKMQTKTSSFTVPHVNTTGNMTSMHTTTPSFTVPHVNTTGNSTSMHTRTTSFTVPHVNTTSSSTSMQTGRLPSFTMSHDTTTASSTSHNVTGGHLSNATTSPVTI